MKESEFIDLNINLRGLTYRLHRIKEGFYIRDNKTPICMEVENWGFWRTRR